MNNKTKKEQGIPGMHIKYSTPNMETNGSLLGVKVCHGIAT